MKIGCHISITPSILDGLKYSISIGANSGQIFLGSNQSSSLKSKQHLTPENITQIKTFIQNNDFYLSIHAIYLLNFCSFPPNSKRIKYAQDNLIYDLEMGEKIGAKCVVLHIGVRKSMNKEEVYTNMADNILYILSRTFKTAKNIRLLLETPAGQGTQIATTVEELAELWNLIISRRSKYNLNLKDIKKRLGFCIDTAHIFSSGYAIRMPLGMNQYLDKFDDLIGLDKVGLIHLNDSKADLNSRRDLHEGIGDGYIFGIEKIKNSWSKIPITKKDYLQNLITLLQRCKKAHIPALVLETHKAGSPYVKGGELYTQELGLLQELINNPEWINDNKNWKLKHLDDNYLLKKSEKSVYNVKNYTKRIKNISRRTKKVLDSKNIRNDIIGSQVYPTNLIIVNKLKLIREYYQKIENDSIRSLAYGKAILAIKNYPEEIIYANQLNGVKGIGPKIIKKVGEYLETGEMEIFKERNILSKLEKYKENEKMKISSILGFGQTRATELSHLGIKTYQELLNAVKTNKVQLNEKEMIGFKYHMDLIKMIPRKETEVIFNKIQRLIKKDNLDKEYGLEMELSGSYPSGKVESKDIDILIFTNKVKDRTELRLKGVNILDEVINILRHKGIIIDVISKGFGMIMCLVRLDKKHPVRHLDIRLIPKKSEIFGRLFFTSGRDFNQVMRQRAKELGMLLNEMDLIDKRTGKSVFTEKEKIGLKETDIFDKLGLSFIPMIKRR